MTIETAATPDSVDDWESRPTTAPDRYAISVRGLETEQKARELGGLVGDCIRELSRIIDLQGLDGATIAANYGEALAELDRGYPTSHKLAATGEHAIGVAMTPTVIRDGTIKSHMLFRADLILPLADPESDDSRLALHLLAHECAHVELTSRFDKCFPGTLLQKPLQDIHQSLRWQTIKACWDEYGATWISANIGRDPTDYYEETFGVVLNATRSKSNDCIKEFRLHGDAGRVLTEVYEAHGDLMKFASYLLGTMRGRGLTLNNLRRTKEALEGHWFLPFFERLQNGLQDLGNNYGKWGSLEEFEPIGGIADELVAAGGLRISPLGDGRFYVDFP